MVFKTFIKLFPQPCYLKDWEMHVQYKVHGSGKKNLHGDGIALWYTKERLHPGNVTAAPLTRHTATLDMDLADEMSESTQELDGLHLPATDISFLQLLPKGLKST